MDSNQTPEVEKLPSDLVIQPDGTAIFTISEEGDVQGSYKGVFVLRCFLNPTDQLQAGRIFREHLGPYGADASEGDKFVAFALSQLQKRVIKGPPWWRGDTGIDGNIPDHNVLSLVLDRAITAETAYKNRLKEKKAEALQRSQNAVQAQADALKADLKRTDKVDSES